MLLPALQEASLTISLTTPERSGVARSSCVLTEAGGDHITAVEVGVRDEMSAVVSVGRAELPTSPEMDAVMSTSDCPGRTSSTSKTIDADVTRAPAGIGQAGKTTRTTCSPPSCMISRSD